MVLAAASPTHPHTIALGHPRLRLLAGLAVVCIALVLGVRPATRPAAATGESDSAAMRPTKSESAIKRAIRFRICHSSHIPCLHRVTPFVLYRPVNGKGL